MKQDDIYLIDIWRIFVREWRWFAIGLLIVLAGTWAYSHAAKPQWEATAWIQVGQLGVALPGQDPKIEPFQRVIMRLQTVAFQNDVLKSAGFSAESPQAQLYRKSFKLEPDPYANLIKVSIRARSPQQAMQLATATVTQLEAIHQRIEALPLKLAHERLDEIQTELQSSLVDRDRLQQIGMAGSKDDADSKNAANAATAIMLLAIKNEAIRNLQQARGDIVYHLSVNYTYDTSMPWPIAVPAKQASPNLALVWGAGIFFGLFLGGLAAMARNAYRRS
jgi:uncharacterized protein involved in exopolysaccharide biosynthesis